jgi:hypothetical protein
LLAAERDNVGQTDEACVLIGILMTVGVAATVGAMRVGVSMLLPFAVEPVVGETQRRVTLGPTRLRYFEDDNILTLFAEMARDRDGYYYVVYVPVERKWVKQMPEWCRHRRAEIMGEIKRLTAGERIKSVESGDTMQLPNKVLQTDDHFAPSVARR